MDPAERAMIRLLKDPNGDFRDRDAITVLSRTRRPLFRPESDAH
jgi:hypothetical protein